MTTAEASSTMAPRPELTLIVAATSKMGIGLKGTLPWTGLRKEMAYFARVTKRAGSSGGSKNAVIMGRKTWESIPPKFRPLKDRKNVVISRTLPPSSDSSDDTETVFSIEDAIQSLSTSTTIPNEHSTGTEDNKDKRSIDRAFIIGGAQIYEAALERPETKRILLTRILEEFECDTFFPVVLPQEGSAEGGWKRRDTGELAGWTGEGEGIGREKEENGTKYVFEMWEREG